MKPLRKQSYEKLEKANRLTSLILGSIWTLAFLVIIKLKLGSFHELFWVQNAHFTSQVLLLSEG